VLHRLLSIAARRPCPTASASGHHIKVLVTIV